MKKILSLLLIFTSFFTKAQNIHVASLNRVLNVGNISSIPIVDSNSVTGDSAAFRNGFYTGNFTIGDSILTQIPTYWFYGSSLTASPGPCANVGWVTLFVADRQITAIDSAIPGTGISPNCPLNPSQAWVHRFAGLPFHTPGAKFFIDAGVNDAYSDSVAYALALGQGLDTLTMARGWAASDLYVISSFDAARMTDTQLLKVNIKVCTPRGVNIIDVLHVMYYHYHNLNQVVICSDSTHPQTLGQYIAESVISNAVKTGHFRGNMQNSGSDTIGINLTVKGTSVFKGKIFPLGGYQQTVNNGHFDHFGIQTNGGDYSEERFITSNVAAGDSMSIRHTVQAGNGSSFDFMHYETTGPVNMLHMGGSTNAIVINGTTPLAGYLVTINGAASMGQANVTAGLYVAGDANYIPYRIPLFTNGGNHIGIGINSSNVCEFDNAFGPWAFGSGGASFVAKTEVLANGHLLLNIPASSTDTLTAWLQNRGTSYLGDSVNLGRVPTGNTTTDSVLMIGTNHYLHKVAASSFGSGGGGIAQIFVKAPVLIFGTDTVGVDTTTALTGLATKAYVLANAGSGSGVTTVGTFSASSQTNGATISGVTITYGPADGTNAGMIKPSGSQTLGSTLILTMPGGSIFGFGTGNNTLILRGSTAIHIGDNATQNTFINESPTTGTGVVFIRTATQFNLSDVNILGQVDITGNFLFNSTSGTTGGRLLSSGSNIFEDNMTSTGDFNWRTNAGGTSLMRLVGTNLHLLVGGVTDQTVGQLQSTSTTAAQEALYYDATHFFSAQVASTGILSWANLTGWKVPSAAFGTTVSGGDSVVYVHNTSGIETMSIGPIVVPTLQQVLTSGATLTSNNTIALGGHLLTMSGGNVTVGGYLSTSSLTGVFGSTPGLSTGTGIGTGGGVSANITGTDLGGKITIATGLAPSGSSNIVVITFVHSFADGSSVTITPGDPTTAALSGITSVSVVANLTTFTIASNTTGLAPSTNYSWYYTANGY